MLRIHTAQHEKFYSVFTIHSMYHEYMQ